MLATRCVNIFGGAFGFYTVPIQQRPICHQTNPLDEQAILRQDYTACVSARLLIRTESNEDGPMRHTQLCLCQLCRKHVDVCLAMSVAILYFKLRAYAGFGFTYTGI